MSDALREAIRFNSGDKVRKKAAAAILEQTVIKVGDYLATANKQSVEIGQLIDQGDRDAAIKVALKGREVLLKSRKIMRDDIIDAISLLQGEDRREAIKTYGGLFDMLSVTLEVPR